MTTATRFPVLYLPHGGGPLPLLGDPQHKELAKFLSNIGKQLPEPVSIIVVSAHWEEPIAKITGAAQPEIIYDYFGFPEPSYHIRYDAPGNPSLAKSILELLQTREIEAEIDNQRGFDHGLFVPLKLMYPDAKIPCVQLSLVHGLDPATHIDLGRALASLRQQNCFIIGSGLSFHNLRAFFRPDIVSESESDAFHHWLIDTCSRDNISPQQRSQQLVNWEQAPYARLCHPREEHLLPLQVCYGAAMDYSPQAEVVFNQKLMGHNVAGLLWR